MAKTPPGVLAIFGGIARRGGKTPGGLAEARNDHGRDSWGELSQDVFMRIVVNLSLTNRAANSIAFFGPLLARDPSRREGQCAHEVRIKTGGQRFIGPVPFSSL